MPPEERQMFKAEVIYRKEEPNGFSKLMSKTVRLAGDPEVGDKGGSDNNPLERFDMSAFCSSERHAETFARYALAPSPARHAHRPVSNHAGVLPRPEAWRLRPLHQHRHPPGPFCNGFNWLGRCCPVPPRSKTAKWQTDHVLESRQKYGVREATLRVDDNMHCKDDVLYSSVFAVADDETRSRIYKVETIQYGEDGLVDLTLTEAPVDSKLRLLVLDWRDDDFYEYN